MMHYYNNQRHITAFSILELALVLAAIAIVTGAYIISKDIINSYRRQALIQQIKEIRGAVEKFEGLYNAIPGDVANPNLDITFNGGTPLVGNGNNVIDSDEEAVLFWKHLSNANLYNKIATSGDVADINKVSSKSIIGGVPEASYPSGAGLRLVLNSSKGIEVELSNYDNTNNNLAALTPKEALLIDRQYDDSNPNTGFIRAVDGSDVPANSCVNGGTYNVANDNKACVLRFIIRSNKIDNNTSAAPTCNGLPIGTTRQSSSDNCPYGYIGRVIEECTITGPGTAAFVNTKRLCQPVKCANDTFPGQKIDLPCPYGYSGNIEGTCESNGIISYNNNCTIDTGKCKNFDNNIRENSRTLACPLGQQGYVHQFCDGNNWQTIINNCTNLTCSGNNIGANSTNITIGCNNPNYTKANDAANRIAESCTLNDAGNLTPATHNVCRPTYVSSNCAVGSTRDIGCPRAQTGEHIQKCVGNNGTDGLYHTIKNTCIPVTCGDGSPIGTVRPSANIKCNQGESGTVYETCTLNGSQDGAFWAVNFANCSKLHCRNDYDSGKHNAGLGTYNQGNNTYEANNIYTADNCNHPDFDNSSNAVSPNRRCGYDGFWHSRNKACGPSTTCPQLDANNTGSTQTLWSETIPAEHGEYKIIKLLSPGNVNNNQCIAGHEIDEDANLICNSRGQWVDYCQVSTVNPVNTRIRDISESSYNLTPRVRNSDTNDEIYFYRDTDNDIDTRFVCNAATQGFDEIICQVCHAGACSYGN